MAESDSRLRAAQQAIESIGLGFDLTKDISFNNCKWGSRLIMINTEQSHNLEIPGGVSIPNVPISIKCYRGECLRIHSGVLSFQQMLRHFNEELWLSSSEIAHAPGNFLASFGISDRCIKDFGSIESLAYDGWFIKRYTIELEKHQGELTNRVKDAVPSSWDPKAMARLIEEFGTHVVVGVSMGGKDVLYLRKSHSSNLQRIDLQELLKDKADMRFTGSTENSSLTSEGVCYIGEDLVVISSRRGGSTEILHHKKWFDTVDLEPDVISMFLVPLTSLFPPSVPGIGFLSYAINQYLRYKPPINWLSQFLEFQLPRNWAPLLGGKGFGFHGKHQHNTWLRFSLFGNKLYIDTFPVDVGNKPVVGLRLQLVGRRSNRLAIQLQHLNSLPNYFPLSDNYLTCDSYNCTSHQKVSWNRFSYVCTAPVESDDALSYVTGAQLQVKNRCLSLLLRFSKVIGSTLQENPVWEFKPELDSLSHKSLEFCGLFTKERQEKSQPKPGDVTIRSTQNQTEPPIRVNPPKHLRFVDTTDIVRGPEYSPGCWVVSGARLVVQYGRLHLMVKYSLLNVVTHIESKA